MSTVGKPWNGFFARFVFGHPSICMLHVFAFSWIGGLFYTVLYVLLLFCATVPSYWYLHLQLYQGIWHHTIPQNFLHSTYIMNLVKFKLSLLAYLCFFCYLLFYKMLFSFQHQALIPWPLVRLLHNSVFHQTTPKYRIQFSQSYKLVKSLCYSLIHTHIPASKIIIAHV